MQSCAHTRKCIGYFPTSERTERTYPVVTKDSTKLYNKYLEKANALGNVYFLGTLGDFKRYELDETIARAIEVFENLNKK